MDFGSEFDDDFFEKPKEKQLNYPSNYEAKVCKPLWYMDVKLAEKEKGDALIAMKHQADYHYFSKNYPKAIEIYENCLELVPPSNNTWKREFMENLARAFLHTGDAQKALEWSLKLDMSSFSPDQKIVSMNLLAVVCHTLGKYEEELEALHSCVEVHKSCPEFWQRLGLCYAGLFKINLPDYSLCRPEALPDDAEPCCVFNSRAKSCRHPHTQEVGSTDSTLVCPSESAISCSSSSAASEKCSSTATSTKCDVCILGTQIVSSCLIHTRMLIDSGGANRLGVEKDERTKEKIANSLIHMEVEQSFIDEASQMLGPDFLSGLQRHDGTSEQQRNFSTHHKVIQEHNEDV